MKKITLELPDELFTRLEKKSLEETLKQAKFVGIADTILPILEKEFKK